jgi:hypothetical protein
MGGRIEQFNWRVPAFADDLSAGNYDAAGRHLSGGFGIAGKIEREPHPVFMIHNPA